MEVGKTRWRCEIRICASVLLTVALAGVAAGFDELTEDLTHKLHKAEAELTAKTVELEEAKAEIARLQAKLNSHEP